ncbi:MAG: NAD(P)/FAD-dependent oxidoreductase [Halococcoides sp.]
MARSYVILGDGIAGSSAAETIREEDPDGSITVVTDEDEPLYNRILIKEFAKGTMPEAPIQIHEESWYTDRDIELRLGTRVTDIDTGARRVETADGDDLDYDRLLVATGGTPTRLPVEGATAEGVHYFWTFDDARRIREAAGDAERSVVVGAGLLGIDLAAICGAQGVAARYLMRGNRWWRYALSEAGAEIVHEGLREKGVTPVFDSGVERFEVDAGHVTAAIDSSGSRHPADFVGIAVGLDFNTAFLDETPVECADGIVVDEHMATGTPGIYAAGDITQYHDVILDDRTQNGTWGSAKEQGVVAGRNMVADDDPATFRYVPSYSITHFEFPFLSFGHPTIGEEHAERTYEDGVWRRLAFRDGALVGGVLIGDVSQQRALKTVIREERPVADHIDALLAEEIDLDALPPSPVEAAAEE